MGLNTHFISVYHALLSDSTPLSSSSLSLALLALLATPLQLYLFFCMRRTHTAVNIFKNSTGD